MELFKCIHTRQKSIQTPTCLCISSFCYCFYNYFVFNRHDEYDQVSYWQSSIEVRLPLTSALVSNRTSIKHHPLMVSNASIQDSYPFYVFFSRVWFRQPTTNIQVLKERQKAVAFFHSPQNVENTASIQDCLKHVKCVSVSITRNISRL
jgi:hypothetical protein